MIARVNMKIEKAINYNIKQDIIKHFYWKIINQIRNKGNYIIRYGTNLLHLDRNLLIREFCFLLVPRSNDEYGLE